MAVRHTERSGVAAQSNCAATMRSIGILDLCYTTKSSHSTKSPLFVCSTKKDVVTLHVAFPSGEGGPFMVDEESRDRSVGIVAQNKSLLQVGEAY